MKIFDKTQRWQWFVWFVTLAVTGLFGCGEEEKPPEVIRSIKWMTVIPSEATQVRKISGVVEPVNETKLSFEVGGRVDAVMVRLGDRVEKDAVLAKLDPQPFELEVQKARSDRKAAEAKATESKANFERIRALYESNNASKAEYDSARADYDSARSRSKAARAQEGLAQRDLRLTVLKAPFTGVISVKQVEPHEEIRSGQTLFQLDGEDDFEVATAVPEQVVIKLNAGQEADIVFPTLNNRRVKGVITEIGTKSVTANTFPVTVELKEQSDAFRSGMSVEVAFAFMAAEQSGAFVSTGYRVPLPAVLSGAQEQYFVFIYDEATSTVIKSPVKILDISENELIIESGVKAGDIIATAGVEFLADQQKVNLMQ